MKTALRLSAIGLSVLLLSACAGSKGSAKGADEASSEKGCSEVDPFCGQNGGGEETASGDEGSSSAGDADSSGSGDTAQSGASATTAGPKDLFAEFKKVIVVKKPAAPAESEKGKQAGKPAASAAKTAPPKDGVPAGKILLHPRGLTWGMGSEQIAKQYDRLLDEAYRDVYKKTPVGPQLDALDAEVKDSKALIRRNRIDFGNLPTGVDNTALKGEYSYMNKESMTKLDLENGVVRFFFFFGDRLWKIYDEHSLGKDSPLGGSWESAIEYLAGEIGSKPKLVEAGAGKIYDEAEWRDGSTYVRAVNREATKTIGIVLIDESVQSKLPSLRKNRLQDPTAVDSSVREVTSPPPPPAGQKKPPRK